MSSSDSKKNTVPNTLPNDANKENKSDKEKVMEVKKKTGGCCCGGH